MATALAARPEDRYPNISVMMNDLWGAQTALIPDEGRARAVALAAATGRRPRQRTRLSVPVAASIVAAALILIVSVALVDRLVVRPRARGDAPVVSPVNLDQHATPPDDRQPSAEGPAAPSAMPAVRTVPMRITEPPAVKETATGSVRAVEPAVPAARPAPAVSPAPAARPAPAATRKADEGDGSAIIDWLLQNQR